MSDTKKAAVATTTTDMALSVKQLLREMGVEDYEPRVVYQVLEFAKLYTQNVVSTAEEYAAHAQRQVVSHSDVSLALGKGSKGGPSGDPLGVLDPVMPTGFPSKPNVQLLRAVAAKVNTKPLPKIQKKIGLSLPPDENCLTAQNFELRH